MSILSRNYQQSQSLDVHTQLMVCHRQLQELQATILSIEGTLGRLRTAKMFAAVAVAAKSILQRSHASLQSSARVLESVNETMDETVVLLGDNVRAIEQMGEVVESSLQEGEALGELPEALETLGGSGVEPSAPGRSPAVESAPSEEGLRKRPAQPAAAV